jgi:DNA-binding Lrp family transcriptional regulator
MKLKNLAEAIQMLHRNDLDEVDALVLNEVALGAKGEPVTIMNIAKGQSSVSSATVHARIKRLCERNILKKTTRSDNQRFKTLEFGPAFSKISDQLGEV